MSGLENFTVPPRSLDHHRGSHAPHAPLPGETPRGENQPLPRRARRGRETRRYPQASIGHRRKRDQKLPAGQGQVGLTKDLRLAGGSEGLTQAARAGSHAAFAGSMERSFQNQESREWTGAFRPQVSITAIAFLLSRQRGSPPARRPSRRITARALVLPSVRRSSFLLRLFLFLPPPHPP